MSISLAIISIYGAGLYVIVIKMPCNLMLCVSTMPNGINMGHCPFTKQKLMYEGSLLERFFVCRNLHCVTEARK